MNSSENSHSQTFASDWMAWAKSFIGAIPIPAMILDEGRIVQLANEAACGAFPIPKTGLDLARSIRNPLLLDAVDSVIGHGERVNCELDTSGYPNRFYEASIALIEGTDPKAILILFIDRTMVRKSQNIRSTFVANVSHELRSPLTTLMGAAETLEGAAKDDEKARERMISLMSRESRRMKYLIDDLLSLSQVEAQEFISPDESAKLPTILTAVCERLEERAKALSMKLELEIPPHIEDVLGVQGELFQVFDNLISNAIKYGAENTPVRVSVSPKDNMLQVNVQNQGPVIPSEHLPRLTERFYRVDKSRSRELGGTGLGLAIVKHILNRHHGRLLIESSEEEGTVFSVCLPTQSK